MLPPSRREETHLEKMWGDVPGREGKGFESSAKGPAGRATIKGEKHKAEGTDESQRFFSPERDVRNRSGN